MKRKDFLKKGFLGVLGSVLSTNSLHGKDLPVKKETIGFNHLPNREIRTIKTVLHKSETRGVADHGWLSSRHSFSFANYYHPDRMNFGVLRVLNDDVVEGGKGFGMHPHKNMEIISIPLSGDLEHKDSMGNEAVIREGDIQVMSAGTGIYHSEYNKRADETVKFLQIWMFPNKENVQPRYDQLSIKEVSEINQFYQILSPSPDDQGVWVHQNAWFSMGDFEGGSHAVYTMKDNKNGVYFFVLKGEVTIEGQILRERDGFGIWDVSKITVKTVSSAKILLMEIPMKV